MKNIKSSRTLGRYIILGLLFGLITLDSVAQFTLSGEVRPRTEYRHGFKTPPAKNQDVALFTDQRTRLNFGYKTEGYETFIQLQDIRVWGATSQLNLSDGFSSVHQAWGIAKFNKKFGLKFGRQEIILDDHRIFGNVGWAQQARSHDAAVFLYSDSTFSLQLGGAYNQDKAQINTNLYTVTNNYKALQYLWFNKVFNKNLALSVLFLNNGIQATQKDTSGNITNWKDNYSQTMGASLKFNKDRLSGRASFYYQTGVNGDWANTKISGIDALIDVEYKLSDKFSVHGGFEYLSGTSQTDTANTVLRSFNPFYGTNHKFNGLMDNFYVGNHIGTVGLQDGFFGLGYKQKKFFVKSTLHFFIAAADVMDAAEFASTGLIQAMPSGLGQELDIVFGFNLSKGVSLKGGYSQMFVSNTLVALKGGGGSTSATSNWGWVMVTIKPKFIGG